MSRNTMSNAMGDERPAQVGPAQVDPAQVTSAPQETGRSELRRRRDALAEQVTELHWDLGGLAYEMAIRDHFRLDVLVRRAAVLQERDAELAEIERLLRLEESASAGACPHCAAPHSRGALFCWQCGAALMKQAQTAPSAAAPPLPDPSESASPVAAPSIADGSTAMMDTLIGPASRHPARDGEASGAFGVREGDE